MGTGKSSLKDVNAMQSLVQEGKSGLIDELGSLECSSLGKT
jgi:hypothetical protein